MVKHTQTVRWLLYENAWKAKALCLVLKIRPLIPQISVDFEKQKLFLICIQIIAELLLCPAIGLVFLEIYFCINFSFQANILKLYEGIYLCSVNDVFSFSCCIYI